MSSTVTPTTPQGNAVAIGIPDSMDIPRLVYCAPYFTQVPLAELIEPSVVEAVEAALPSLVPPYVDAAAIAAVQQNAVLLTGSTMSGPLFLNPTIPTQPSQAASMQYVDLMLATAGIPEVPPVPAGQVWARETGQWVPVSQTEGTFLPISGGTMTGNISMSGNTINNLASVPTLPNGAAPAQWVLNQIASVSLYQGTWNADTNVPDLTQLMYRVNGYTWIAITTSVSGVVVGQAIPGLQGVTVYNGDTIIYSTVQGEFTSIHAGGLTLPEADARYVQLAGSQMSGALLLNANASDPLQAVTLQQMQAAVANAGIGEAPNTGQLYGRNGLTTSWAPVLPLAGGILTGALTLSGNATSALQAVPFQQLNSAISGAVAGYLPLTGGTMSGLLTLSGNAANPLNPVTLQQVSGMLGGYLPLSGGTLTGALNGTSITTSGQVLANGPVIVSGATTPTLNSMYLQYIPAQNLAVLNWSPTWYDGVNLSTGYRIITGPAGTLMTIDPSGWATFTHQLTAQGAFVCPTIQFTNQAGTFAFSFGGSGASQVMSVGINGAAPTESVVLGITGLLSSTLVACNTLGVDSEFSVCWATSGAGSLNWPITWSDRRLKKNIEPASDALAIVNRLGVHAFDYTSPLKGAPTERWGYGFLADEVQPLLPSAFVPVHTEDGYQQLRDLPLLATLWRATQELSARSIVTSDDRVKTVTGNYPKSLAAIMQLQPIQFTYDGNDTFFAPAAGETVPYKESPNYRNATQGTVMTGLSAQSLQAVFPECVIAGSGFIDGAAVTNMLQVNTAPLLFALINAINELGTRMAALDGKAAT